MIQNGKHIVYDGTKSTLASIMYSMMRITRGKLISAMYKQTALLNYVLYSEKKQLHHYYDMTIQIDMAHEYIQEHMRYEG